MSGVINPVLSALHVKLSETLTGILENGEVQMDKEGVAVKVSPSAGMLGVIRQFLKDNEIKGIPAEGSELAHLVGAANSKGITLPFEGDDAPQHLRH